jgi:hypothetical protein
VAGEELPAVEPLGEREVESEVEPEDGLRVETGNGSRDRRWEGLEDERKTRWWELEDERKTRCWEVLENGPRDRQ